MLYPPLHPSRAHDPPQVDGRAGSGEPGMKQIHPGQPGSFANAIQAQCSFLKQRKKEPQNASRRLKLNLSNGMPSLQAKYSQKGIEAQRLASRFVRRSPGARRLFLLQWHHCKPQTTVLPVRFSVRRTSSPQANICLGCETAMPLGLSCP